MFRALEIDYLSAWLVAIESTKMTKTLYLGNFDSEMFFSGLKCLISKTRKRNYRGTT